MSKINYQALREAAAAVETVATPQKLVALSRMEVSASPNWKQSNPLRKNWFAVKAAITVSKTIVRWLHCLA